MRFLLILSTSILAAASIESVQLSRSLGFLEPAPEHSPTQPKYQVRGFLEPIQLIAGSLQIGTHRPITVRFGNGTPSSVSGPRTTFAVHQFSGPAANWRRNIAALQSVTYQGVAAGTDVQIVPRRDLGGIEFNATLAAGTTLTSFYLEGTDITLTAPAAWQLRNGVRTEVAAELVHNSAHRYFIQPGTYDSTQPLFVSVRLSVPSERFGGLTGVSPGGDVLIAGVLAPNNVCELLVGGVPRYCSDVWVAGVSPAGALQFFTQLGGEFIEQPLALAAAPNGDILVGGFTASGEFPVSADALQKVHSGSGDDAFVTRLAARTGDLIASTFYGARGRDESASSISAQGQVLVAIENQLILLDANLTRALATKTPASGAMLLANGETSYWDGQALVRVGANLGSQRAAIPMALPVVRQYTLANGNLVVQWGHILQYFLSEISADGTRELRRVSLQAEISSAPVLPEGGFAVAFTTTSPTLATTRDAILAASCKGFLEPTAMLQRVSADGGVVFSTYLPDKLGTLLSARTDSATKVQFFDATHLTLHTVNLEAPTPPALTCVTGAAIRAVASAISPGQIITLLGSGFGTANTEVYINNIKAPLLYVSPLQINAVVPYEGVTPGATATIEVRPAAGPAMRITSPVRFGAVELFTQDSSGSGPAAAFNQDGTLNTADHPARTGSIVVLYGTGIGATNPASVTGAIAPLVPPFPQPLQRVTARIGQASAEVLYAGAAPGLIHGAAQFNLRVPAALTTGSWRVQILLGDAPSTTSASIWIQTEN